MTLSKTQKQRLQKAKKYQAEIIKLLDSKGWEVVVAEGGAVVKNPNDPQPYKYWFIMPFVGSKRSE
jgi:hypothetical protein